MLDTRRTCRRDEIARKMHRLTVAISNDPELLRTSKRSGKMVFGTLVLAVAVYVAHGLWWRFLCDDAYIAFRFAENWSNTGFPVFNPELAEKVQGFTSPGWVALLAALHSIGLSVPVAAQVLSWCAACSVLVLAHVWTFTQSRDADINPQIAIAPLILSLLPAFVVWSSSGLETMLCVALGGWSLHCAMTRRWIRWGVFAALLAVMRLDQLVWALCAAAVATRCDMFDSSRQTRQIRREQLIGLSLVVFAIVSVLGLQHWFYGDWLPNTWQAKSPTWHLRREWGTQYLLHWAQDVRLWWTLPVLLRITRRHAPLLVVVICNLAYCWWVGGDFMAYSRFALPATVAWSLVVGLVVQDSLAAGRLAPQWRWPLRVILGLLALGLIVQADVDVQKDRREDWVDHRFESVRSMARFAEIRLHAGSALASVYPRNTYVLVGAAGAMPYASGFITHDVYGLVDRAIAYEASPVTRPRPGHMKVASFEQMTAKGADLWCATGYVGKKPPARETAKLGRRVIGRWQCVEVEYFENIEPWQRERARVNYCCVQRPQLKKEAKMPSLGPTTP